MLKAGECELGPSSQDTLEIRPVVIWDVKADNYRSNVVLFKPALPTLWTREELKTQQTLVFFGGDIQNLMQQMDEKDEVFPPRRWSLEAAALRLGKGFPTHHIVVFKPNRFEERDVSCYDHFVHTDTIGMAMHTYEYKSLPYLQRLLLDISMKLRRMDPETLFKMMLQTAEEDLMQDQNGIEDGEVMQYKNLTKEQKKLLWKWQKKIRLHNTPLTLVAFAKGCTVLNQLVYEMHYARALEPNRQDSSFIDRIKAMYWLDSGFCGHHHVYPTSRGLLVTLASLGIKIRVHVSLYMVEDEDRPWIRDQCNKFVETLEELKTDVLIIRHVSPTEDIASHFSVLQRFKYVEDSHSKNIKSPKIRINVKLPPVQEVVETERQRIRQARPELEKTPRQVTLINPNHYPFFVLKMILHNPDAPMQGTNNPAPNPRVATPYPGRRPDPPPYPPEPMLTRHETMYGSGIQTTFVSWEDRQPVYSFMAQQVFTEQGRVLEGLDLIFENEATNQGSICRRTEMPVVVLPSHGFPERLAIYKPFKHLYTPTVYNHLYVVDEHNKNDAGVDLDSSSSDDDSEASSTSNESDEDSSGSSSASSQSDSPASRSQAHMTLRSSNRTANSAARTSGSDLSRRPPRSQPNRPSQAVASRPNRSNDNPVLRPVTSSSVAHDDQPEGPARSSLARPYPRMRPTAVPIPTPTVPTSNPGNQDSRIMNIEGRTYSNSQTESNTVTYAIRQGNNLVPLVTTPGSIATNTTHTIPITIPVATSSRFGINLLEGNLLTESASIAFDSQSLASSSDRPGTEPIPSARQTVFPARISWPNAHIRSILSASARNNAPNPVRSNTSGRSGSNVLSTESSDSNRPSPTVPASNCSDSQPSISGHIPTEPSPLSGTEPTASSVVVTTGPQTDPGTFCPEPSTSRPSLTCPVNSDKSVTDSNDMKPVKIPATKKCPYGFDTRDNTPGLADRSDYTEAILPGASDDGTSTNVLSFEKEPRSFFDAFFPRASSSNEGPFDFDSDDTDSDSRPNVSTNSTTSTKSSMQLKDDKQMNTVSKPISNSLINASGSSPENSSSVEPPTFARDKTNTKSGPCKKSASPETNSKLTNEQQTDFSSNQSNMGSVSVGTRAGTSGVQVKRRNDDDEDKSCRYQLRKRSRH